MMMRSIHGHDDDDDTDDDDTDDDIIIPKPSHNWHGAIIRTSISIIIVFAVLRTTFGGCDDITTAFNLEYQWW